VNCLVSAARGPGAGLLKDSPQARGAVRRPLHCLKTRNICGESFVKVKDGKNLLRLTVCLALAATMALAQTNPTFEVASVKPAAPIDMMKMAAAVRSGEMPRIGPRVDKARAEYTYMALRDLIVLAYKVKPYQITGPDWIASQRFDIVAKLPDGASKDDIPKMLQALLEERFKLAVRRESKELPVLALVVGKGGPKMKESAEAPKPIDDSVPLAPGEMKMDTGEGNIRMTMGKDGSRHGEHGSQGHHELQNGPSQPGHAHGSQHDHDVGIADMLTQFSQIGGAGGRQVVDMTELKETTR